MTISETQSATRPTSTMASGSPSAGPSLSVSSNHLSGERMVRILYESSARPAVIVDATLEFEEDSLVSVAGGGAVWIFDAGHTLRVDPASGAVTGCVPGAILAVGKRYRWSVDRLSGEVTATPSSTPSIPC